MSKNLSKIIAFAIGISVISGSAVPVFAAETKVTVVSSDSIIQNKSINKPILTLEEAINDAIANSDVLKLYDKKIKYQSNINNANEKLEDAQDIDDDIKDHNEDSRELNLKKLKQERDFEEDKLIKKVTDGYNNLISNQMQINNLQKQFEINNEKFNDTKLMNNLGLTTQIDVEEYDIGIKTFNNNLNLLKGNLTNSQDSFKVLTGKDATKYVLEQDINYEVFRIDGSVDEYLDDVINDYLDYSEQMIELNKDYLNDNKVKDPGSFTEKQPNKSDYQDDEEEGGKTASDKYNEAKKVYETNLEIYAKKIAARISYLQSKLSIFEGQTNLDESKKSLKDALKNYYVLLMSKEEEINILKQKVELGNKKLSITKLKYDLGTITKSEYDTVVCDSLNLDFELRKAIDSYNQTKEKIQKPWIGLS